MNNIAVLFRHFKTEDDLFRLHTPSESSPVLLPIDPLEQAFLQSEVDELVNRHNIRLVIHSGNDRGERTANILFANCLKHITILSDERLRNMDQPEWTGLKYEEIIATRIYSIWHTKPSLAQFKNGECLSNVISRIDGVLKAYGSEPIFVISHTTPLQVLLCRMLKINPDCIWSFKFDFNAFTFIGNGTLLRLNTKQVADVNLEELHQPPRLKTRNHYVNKE